MKAYEQLEQLLNVLGVSIQNHLIKIGELQTKLQDLVFDFTALTETAVNKNKLLQKFLKGEAIPIQAEHDKIDLVIAANQLVQIFRSVLKFQRIDVADIMWSNSQLRDLFTKAEILINFEIALSSQYAPAIEALWKDRELKKQFAGNGVSLIELRYRFALVLASGNRAVIDEIWRTNAVLQQDVRKYPFVNVNAETEAIFKQLLLIQPTPIECSNEDHQDETSVDEDSMSASTSGLAAMNVARLRRSQRVLYSVKKPGNNVKLHSQMKKTISQSARSYWVAKGASDERQMCSNCGFFIPEREDDLLSKTKKEGRLEKKSSGYNLLLYLFPPTTPCC